MTQGTESSVDPAYPANMAILGAKLAGPDVRLGLHRISQLESLIGQTPMLAIHFQFRGKRRVVHAKWEQPNATGSIKDRMALHILRRAYEQEAISPGDRIAEATSGNTGIAFASIGRTLGHPVTIFMPNWMSHERMDLIRGYGARIVLVSKEEGGFLGSIRRAEELANTGNVFLPRQFSNQANAESHELTTGPEIEAQLARCGRTADAFVAGVGTGGTVMGVGNYLRRRNPQAKIYPVEPAESPTLSTGCKVGHHRIQGISDEFIPALVELDKLEAPVAISDGDSVIMAQRLASELGLGVGISSGCNLLAAITVQEQLGGDATVATVFADDNKKYLSTDLVREEPNRDDYMCNEIRLEGCEVIPRVQDADLVASRARL